MFFPQGLIETTPTLESPWQLNGWKLL